MLTVERAVLIIRSLQTCLMLKNDTTSHAIARNIGSVSRSTVYRAIARMRELELLNFSLNSKGDKIYYITLKGYEVLEASKELM